MHITYDMVRAGIPEIIATRGEDFIYKAHADGNDTCRYVWEGKPDCLIGCYLVSLGMPIDAFEKHEGSEINRAIVQGLLSDNGFSISTEARRALQDLQTYQDDGQTWGSAYTKVFK